MIEKLTTYPRPLPNNPMIVENIGMDNESLFNKINELVDAVNEIMTWRFDCDDETPAENVQQDDRMIGCETLDIPKSYKSTNDVWRAKLKIATDNLQKIREMGKGTKATPFAMGCVADLALRELDKFDKDVK